MCTHLEDLVWMLVKPLGPNAFYEECKDGSLVTIDENDAEQCVEYVEYSAYDKTSDHFYVEVDVSKWLERDGLHNPVIFVRSMDTLEEFENQIMKTNGMRMENSFT